MVNVVMDCITSVASFFLILIATDRERLRAPWAKSVLVACGILGTAMGIVGLILDMRWLVLAPYPLYRVQLWYHSAGGLVLGFLLSVIFSGQLIGTKRPAPAKGLE